MRMIGRNLDHKNRGIVVIDRHKIAINYLKGWFAIDFISTFPIYAITDQLSVSSNSKNYNNVLRFLRIPRLYKLAKVVNVCYPGRKDLPGEQVSDH
jgi:hypothetical protein